MKQTQAPVIIALVFDFDDTLAPDSTSKVVEAMGVDPPEFWTRHRELMKEGWDQGPAWMHLMLQESRSRGNAVTQELIREVGRNLQLFRGVPGMFRRYRDLVREDPGFEAQFYVISSGLGELIRATRISRELTDCWGSDFAYEQGDGAICAIKNLISFTDKTRYLFQISKGLIGEKARDNPFAVNEPIDKEHYAVELGNMVFVGDGYTDVPCFTLVERYGGRAVAVYDASNRDKVGKAYGFIDKNRVSHVVTADYTKNRGADEAIRLAISNIKDRARVKG